MCTKRAQDLQDVWRLPRKEELAKRVAAAQCTMHNYTANHGPWHNAQCTAAHGTSFECNLCSILAITQCAASSPCSASCLYNVQPLLFAVFPGAFLVFCICNVQLIFISPCVLRLTFTACSISWLHLICKGTFCYVLVQPELLCATFIVLSVLRLSLTLYCVP